MTALGSSGWYPYTLWSLGTVGLKGSLCVVPSSSLVVCIIFQAEVLPATPAMNHPETEHRRPCLMRSVRPQDNWWLVSIVFMVGFATVCDYVKTISRSSLVLSGAKTSSSMLHREITKPTPKFSFLTRQGHPHNLRSRCGPHGYAPLRG